MKAGTLALPFVLLAACTTTAPPLPPATQSRVTSEAGAVGCYEVVAMKWDRAPARLHEILYTPPPKFYLSPEPHPLGKRRVTTGKPEALDAHSGWRFRMPLTAVGSSATVGTLEIIWSDGRDGIEVAVQQQKDSSIWEGVANQLQSGGAAGRVSLAWLTDAPCSDGAR